MKVFPLGIILFLSVLSCEIAHAQLHTGTFSNSLQFSNSIKPGGGTNTYTNVDGTTVSIQFSWDSDPPSINAIYDTGGYSGLSSANFWTTSGMGSNTYTLTISFSGTQDVTAVGFDMVHINQAGGGGDKVTFSGLSASGSSLTPVYTQPSDPDYTLNGNIADATEYDTAPEYNLGVNITASEADPIASISISWAECTICPSGYHGVGMSDIDFSVTAVSEDCSNGVDDDGDGFIDCADGDCNVTTDCPIPSTCTAYAGDISFDISGNNDEALYTTEYLLTNSSSIIQQKSNTTTFSNVAEGQYWIYILNYMTSEGVSNHTVGNAIGSILGNCFEISGGTAVLICGDSDDDGVNDNLDLDDDNDGILDSDECEHVQSNTFSVSNGTTETFSLPAASGGFTIDISSLDNSFNMSINGTDIVSGELQFQSNAYVSGQSMVRFASDNSVHGENGNYTIYGLNYQNANPSLISLRITIGSTGEITLQGIRTPTSDLEDLIIDASDPQLNSISWNTTGSNTVVISQTITGPTSLYGSGYGLDCTNDTDNDNIPNYLDLDSDNDGCADALEGAGDFRSNHLDVNNRLSGSVDTNGVPLLAGASGQGIGDSDNASILSLICTACSQVRTNQHITIQVNN